MDIREAQQVVRGMERGELRRALITLAFERQSLYCDESRIADATRSIEREASRGAIAAAGHRVEMAASVLESAATSFESAAASRPRGELS